MKKLLLAFAAAVTLAGCGQKSTPVESEAAAPPPPAAADSAPQQAAAPTEAELDQKATAAQESTDTAAATPTDTSLERMVSMPESAQLPGGRWKAGTHYRPIVPAQPTSAGPGQVEILEFIWLHCRGCYALNPHVTSWKARLPEWVKFRQEHVMWGPAHRSLGRLLYTLDALKRDDLIPVAFDEIHRRNNALVANDDAKTLQMQLAFALANGIPEADFRREYNGFGVNTRLRAAEELTRRYRIESTPMFVVNGKYITDGSMAGGTNDLLQLLNDLAAFEKR
jgi:thiol:disulfide interchange protein DsbA